MRYFFSGVLVALSILSASGLAATGSALSVTNYHLLSQTKQTRTLYLYTYSADLVNTGEAQPSITATVTSTLPSIVVQPGQGSLHFPPAPANSTVTSTNFFTVVVDRTGNDDMSSLVWQFSTPVANAGPNQTVTAGSTVTLDGTGSTNPSGIGTLTYSWAFAPVNGTPTGSAAVIQNPTAVMPTFIADRTGNYNVILTVSNGAGVNSSGVTITTTNSAPVADAGPDQTVPVTSVVTLNGSASHDVDGDGLTYSWSLVLVPSGSLAVLSSATAVSPTFTADKVGTYRAQLTVNDGFTNSAPAQVKISTTDTPPVANAGSSQAVTLGAVVQLDGSQSSDVDGNPLTYLWSFNSVPDGSLAAFSNATIVNPTFTPDMAGTYVVQLIVNDGFDDSMPSTVTISTTVVLAPTANAGLNQTVAHGSRVFLSGSGTDPQGFALTYHWSLTTKPAGSSTSLSDPTAQSPNFTADVPGTYIAQLIVNDGTLDSAPSTVTITTTNTPPVAVAGPPQTVAMGAIVTLDGSQSSDADNDPITYTWSFQSVPSGSNASLLSASIVSPTFIADVAGAYVVQLIVKDPYTSSAPSTVMITATAPATITLSPDPLELSQGGTATLTVGISSAAGGSGQDVNLAILDPSVATVQHTVTIPAGQTSTTVVVTSAGNSGSSTQILASSGGFKPALGTINVTEPSITLTLSNSAVGITKTVTGTITLSTPVPDGGITVNLSAVPTGIVSFPATVAIASGTTGTFQITGVASGATTITAATANYLSGSIGISAATLGAITLPASISVVAGQALPFDVSLVSPAPAGGVIVNLVSSDTTKATVSASVSIDAGATAPAVAAQINGVGIGPATITASAGGFTGATTNVTVIAGLVVTPQTLPVGTTGVLYPTTTLNVSGGTTPYVLSASNLPAGLTFDTATGVLSGTPTANGVGSILVKDSSTPVLSQTLTVTVSPAPFVVSPPSLPGGVVQTAYTPVTISATGGVSPYFMTAASLPAGLSFDATTGILSGTPTAPGTGSILVKDSDTPQQVRTLSVTVNPVLAIGPNPLPTGAATVPYPSTTITATGGSGSYIMTAAGLPAGLTFNSGVLSGTPATAGSVTITVKDTATPAQSGTLTLTVNPVLVVGPNPLPIGAATVPYPSTTITASGGSGSYIMSATGLPTGLSFNSVTGVLSGTPSVTGNGTITVKDTATPFQTATLQVTVTLGLIVSPQTLPTGIVNQAYPSTTITASGGTAPITMTAANLPAGLTFNSATGVLSGMPTATGSGTITIKDSGTPVETSVLTVTVNPVLVIGPNPLPTGAANVAYPSTTVTASGGSGSYIMTAAGLPNGLSFNSVTGVLSGTPTAAGSGTITVKDTATPFQSSALTVTVNAQLVIGPNPMPIGAATIPYPSTTVTASGGSGSYIMTATGLPTGLLFNTVTGVLSGTPATPGSVTITVKDTATPFQTGTLTVLINPVLVVAPNSLPIGTANSPYPSTTISATGGTGSYVMTAAGLPAGLSFNSATGVLSGTPTAPGTLGTITVKDTGTPAQTAILNVTINPAVLQIVPGTLLAGTEGTLYPTTTFSATGGTPPYVFSASLPSGMSFDSGTGVLSGTPTVPGIATISVHDSASPTPMTSSVSATINATPLVITTTSLPDGTIGSTYTGAVAATGGVSPYTFVANSGLPAGLSMRTNGQITGVPTGPAGTSQISVTVTDSESSQGAIRHAVTTVSRTLAGSPIRTAATPATVTATISLVIHPQALVVSTSSLPNAAVGDLYSQNLIATGGTPSYVWSIISGSLPSGLTLNPAGRIQGIPDGTGPQMTTVTLGVTDSGTPQLSAQSIPLTLTVSPSSTTPFLTVSGATVGQNLETAIGVTLTNFTSSTNITVSSSNPSVLLVSKFVGSAGTSSITVVGATTSFVVYVQALANSGTATITAHSTALGSLDGTATITLAPSAFLLSGPNGVGASINSNQNQTIPMSVIAAQLDSSGNPAQTQQVRPVSPAVPVVVSLVNSVPAAGTIPASVSFTGGTDTQTFSFVGGSTITTTVLSVTEPVGYATPGMGANMVAVTVQATQMTPSNVTVGYGLETPAQVVLSSGVPSDLVVTLTSSDPTKVLLSTDGITAGATSITMTVRAPSNHTQEFYIYGLASSGTVGYTASATGFGTTTGLVTLAPSGFVLESQFGIGADFFNVTGNGTNSINVDAAILDSSGNFLQQQAVAGGQSINVTVTSSATAVGTIVSPVTITGGNFFSATTFTPVGPGVALLSALAPAGFVTPAQGASLNANINNPNIRIDTGVSIGNNLEFQGQIFLGAPAPAAGASVLLTVTAGNALLSTTATGVGSASITVSVAAGNFLGTYYIYGKDTLGSVTITASSSGYNSGTGVDSLTPSGIVVYGPFGPGFGMTTALSAGNAAVSVSTAQLDGGDNYVQNQPLAPTSDGLPLQVSLNSSDTTIGTIMSPASIAIGSSTGTVQFMPVAKGSTTVSAPRPSNFTAPATGGTLAVTVN